MEKRHGGRALRSYLGGAAAARVGDEMSGPALLLAGLAATGSASRAAAVPAALMVSAAAGGPLFGVLLDRSARPGRLLAAALGGYAAALAVLLATLDRMPIAATVLLGVLAGPLGPALSGGWTSQLPRVVTAGTLARANALDAMTYDLASLVGPALAGLVAGLSGAPVAVAVAAALICLALAPAWALPRAPAEPTEPTEPAEPAVRRPPHAPIRADLAAGFRAIHRAPALARATTASVVSCVGAGMFITCAPLLGAASLGGAGHGAYLLSGAAASALAANALLARRPRALRPDTVLWSATVLLGAALLLAATTRPPALAAAAILAGAGQGPQLTALFAIRHRDAPAHLRGQVFTTGASLKTTGYALGTALAGPLATRSLPGALLTAAAFQALAAASFALVGRRRDRPPATGAEATSGTDDGRTRPADAPR
ncbi:MFS transporter [Streptomyces sp. NPDC087270]|uniref:MFS transporter n=1 Tax=Streptomyces sp. NPDC087270 TaxID=3365774 RepID=UPI00381BBBA3